MKEEEPSAPSVLDQLTAKFASVVAKDRQHMGVPENNEQSAHSNAYKALCSFSSKSGLVIADEEKQATKDYHYDENKRMQEMNGEKVLRDLCRKNLIKDGNLPQNTVDPLFADAQKMVPSKELVQAFLKMQKECIKFRLSEDDDFIAAAAPGSNLNQGQFENLKKL